MKRIWWCCNCESWCPTPWVGGETIECCSGCGADLLVDMPAEVYQQCQAWQALESALLLSPAVHICKTVAKGAAPYEVYTCETEIVGQGGTPIEAVMGLRQ